METILLTSLSGGCGKTTVAALIASTVENRRTLLVSLDEYSASMSLFFSMESDFLIDVSDYLENSIDEIARPVIGNDSLFLAVRLPFSGKHFSDADFINFLKKSDAFDVAFIDKGAGRAEDIISAALASDRVIVVSEETNASLHSAEVFATLLRENGCDGATLLINSFYTDVKARTYFAGISEIISKVGLPIIGIIPYSDRLTASGTITSAQNDRQLISASSAVSSRLFGEDTRLLAFLPEKVRRKLLNS